jgi:hypothetical protein
MGRDVDYPPPSAEVKERLELYLYSAHRPSWPVTGRIYLYLYVQEYTQPLAQPARKLPFKL